MLTRQRFPTKAVMNMAYKAMRKNNLSVDNLHRISQDSCTYARQYSFNNGTIGYKTSISA